MSCEHLHDTTTRYDRSQKRLSFLRVCPVCHTEAPIETISYVPRFKPHDTTQLAAATVHQLPTRGESLRRAA